MIEIICDNFKDCKRNFPLGTSLREIAEVFKPDTQYPILGALVNNKVKDLNYQVFKPKRVSFFDVSSFIGSQMYLRSLSFLLYKAVKDLYPDCQLIIKHSISGGKYCELNNIPITVDDALITALNKRMRELVEMDIPFLRKELLTEDAIKEFEKEGLHEKNLLFKSRNNVYTSVYYLQDKVNYYYGFLIPSTKYLQVFNVEKYFNGILLQAPSKSNPSRCSKVVKYEKLFNIFQEHKKWVNILGVSYVGDLNKHVIAKTVSNLIKVSEALHEKKLAHIADLIHEKPDVKIILVSGPSSSGKTTFAKRLSVQLKVLGHNCSLLSTDDYFVEREETPKDEHGNFDFERPDAVDLKLFNEHLTQLLSGHTVNLPVFDFTRGSKTYPGKYLNLDESNILIIEGIHALNPVLTTSVEDKYKFKVFVSALTQISVDTQNPIPTNDNRLIRRIVRDYRYRGYSAVDTIKRWPSVRKGEEKYIFPFQENADVMFNSALLAELGILKLYAEPILSEVPENEREYSEAVRLLKFLSYFKRVPEAEIPPTSILREFFGGSSFIY